MKGTALSALFLITLAGRGGPGAPPRAQGFGGVNLPPEATV